MKIFHCTHCQQLVFFENVRCLNCGHALAYLPDLMVMAALEQSADGMWRAPGNALTAPAYFLCANYLGENVCNWAIPADEPQTLCGSCRLTRVIPDLSRPENRAAWYRLEVAKRRLVYALLGLGLTLRPQRTPGDGGLAFEFLQETVGDESGRVVTGHDNGLITINVAEADDLRRERERHRNAEPYRTLLGHFRHESGHYYWDRLIRDKANLPEFRRIFGDERADYQQSLQR
ncbi:MAG TPA: putative zinc-binding metallopeptidase, partial [Steroidobacteraceae bacterium]|nr:putative zinc-binding metallopeptidase [Steroidobacteraceae bacterium]